MTTAPASYVKVSATGSVAHVGAQAVSRYQMIAVKHGLKALQRGMRVNRAYTAKNCLAMVTSITGKTYKGAQKLDLAIADLESEIAKTEQTLPLIREG